MIDDLTASIDTLNLWPAEKELLRELCACYPEAWIPPKNNTPIIKTRMSHIRSEVAPIVLLNEYGKGYRLIFQQNNQGTNQ